jgi:general L-amino acid transport system substrate-binding protein
MARASPHRIDAIRGRGILKCGIWPHVPGFAIEKNGHYSGFDVDICRAVAVATLGDPAKVSFVVLDNVKQFAARADIDLAVRRLTWTLGRESATGMVFGPVTFYDGQGFLVPRASGTQSASELSGQRVCVIDAEHHPKTLYDYFQDQGHPVQLALVARDDEAEKALDEKRCQAYSADISWLAAARSSFRDGVARYEILPQLISKEPLAPLLRAADQDLLQLVQWTIFTLIEAEELGLSSQNIGTVGTGSARVRAFLQTHPDSHVALGAGEWVRAVIGAVGNYGELFDRNLGTHSALKLDRGLNRPWSQGGLLYAPPLR